MRQIVIFPIFFEKKIENFHNRPIVESLLERQYLVLSETLLLLKISSETAEIQGIKVEMKAILSPCGKLNNSVGIQPIFKI